MFVGTEGGQVYIWDLSNQQPNILSGHKSKVTSIAYEAEQNLIATASNDNTVKIWDTRSNGSAIGTYTGHKDCVRDVAISPDGRWIASAGDEGIVKIWELDTRKLIREIP